MHQNTVNVYNFSSTTYSPTHAYIHTTHSMHTHTYMHMHTHTHTHTHTRSRAHTYMHMRIHTYTHTHTHTHTQTDTQTHIQRESSITCTFCSMVALRKAGLNNKKQRGESRLVSCFISTSNALAMEHPGYHDNYEGLGKGQTKSRLSSQQYSQILSYKYMNCCVSKDRPAGMIERGLSLKMVTTHHATSMSSQGGGRSSVGLSRTVKVFTF